MNRLLIKFVALFFIIVSFSPGAFANHPDVSIENAQPYYVGELGAAWQFPSDHLRIGASIGNIHVAHWNILNKNYLYHIESNTQGLRDSAILTDNIPVNDHETITLRELMIGQQILEMVTHSTHPRSLIALEETHQDVVDFLKTRLPASWTIATPQDQSISQDIFLYDKEIFDLVDNDAVLYTHEYPKTIFTLTLREKASNKLFRFIQSHIPGGPVDSPEACAKFSREALRQYDPQMTIVLMGDMNQPPAIIERALNQAAEQAHLSQPYSQLPIEYPTHINPRLQASWIDNFFVYIPESSYPMRANTPEELLSALPPIVQLIKNSKKLDVPL